MSAVVLGVDPGWKRLGLALVEFEPPHRPVWADVVAVDRADGGWKGRQVREALDNGLPGQSAWLESNVVGVGVEKVPMVRDSETFRKLVEVAALVKDTCVKRWGCAILTPTPREWQSDIELQPKSWKSEDVKAATMEWAEERSLANLKNFPLHEMEQDAADALGIATSTAIVLTGQLASGRRW